MKLKFGILSFVLSLVASAILFGSLALAQTETPAASPTSTTEEDNQTPQQAPRTGLGGAFNE